MLIQIFTPKLETEKLKLTGNIKLHTNCKNKERYSLIVHQIR